VHQASERLVGVIHDAAHVGDGERRMRAATIRAQRIEMRAPIQ
jgi:hypothetical protein